MMGAQFTYKMIRNVHLLLAIIALVFFSCSEKKADNRDTVRSGTIRISVDESFKPVIDSQIKVFESQFPNAKILVAYKSEAACLRDLNNDSVRMVIVTRGLDRAEERKFIDSLKFKPAFGSKLTASGAE